MAMTQAERDAIPKEDFADPMNMKYPCDTQAHLDACARLIGLAPSSRQAAIKRRAIQIARRKGLKLPQSWQSG